MFALSWQTLDITRWLEFAQTGPNLGTTGYIASTANPASPYLIKTLTLDDKGPLAGWDHLDLTNQGSIGMLLYNVSTTPQAGVDFFTLSGLRLWATGNIRMISTK
jgi:hypothetical protein